jgi:RecJ-like exonuclease
VKVKLENKECWHCGGNGTQRYGRLKPKEERKDLKDLFTHHEGKCWHCRGEGYLSFDEDIDELDSEKFFEVMYFIAGVMPIYGFTMPEEGRVTTW